MHPLLRLIVTRPQLLADHAQAYADLATAEFAAASVQWRRRVLLNAVAVGCLVTAVVLAGVAVMLWSALPGTPPEALWTLVAVPLVPLVLALGCLAAAHAGSNGDAFSGMRGQMLADLALLREPRP